MAKTFACDISSAVLTQSIIDSLPSQRIEYVNSINDLDRKKQSVFAWKLLQYVLGDRKVIFSVENGKWRCKDGSVFFSISHSLNYVCVSIDEKFSVGVDVELCSNKILKIAKKLSNQKNLNSEQLVKIWTEKESKFKCGEEFGFESDFIFDQIGNKYCITTCANTLVEIISINVNDLIK